jgi:hypothetical protein
MVGAAYGGGFVQIGDVSKGVGGSTGGVDDAIYWSLLTFGADDVPCVIDSFVPYAYMSSAAETGLLKVALYNPAGTTVLDSCADITISSTDGTFYQAAAITGYTITAAGDYPLAFWGDENGVNDVTVVLDSLTNDTVFVMVSQTHGDPWPTAARSNAQGARHLVGYVVVRKGDVIIDGTTDVEDAEIVKGALGAGQQNNYGGSSNIITVEEANNDWQYAAVRCQNVSTRVGASKTVDACTLWFFTNTIPNQGDVSVYRIFKPWNEGALDGSDPADAAEGEGVITWVDWSNDGEEWTTAGCGSADDGGSDNSGDGTGADRKATAEATVTVSAASTWYGFHISATLAQAWYAGTANEEGVLLVITNNDEINFRPSEYSSNQPYWSFYTSDAAVGARPSRERRPIRGVARGVIP